MLVYASKIIGSKILSVQAGGAIGVVARPIVDPDSLKVIAFAIDSPLVGKSGNNILDVMSIREYSSYGMVIDDIDELVAPDDVVRIKKVLDLNFDLVGLKVETKKGSKLGKVIDFTVTNDDFTVQQVVVKRPVIKSFIDPELIISRKEIMEVTDYKLIIKDEEKVIKERAAKEDFVPNFVNPFREQGFAPADNQTPDGQDTE